MGYNKTRLHSTAEDFLNKIDDKFTLTIDEYQTMEEILRKLVNHEKNRN